jgi:putative DNA primase/helicase
MRTEQFAVAVENELQKPGAKNGAAPNSNAQTKTKTVEPLFVTMDSVAPEKVTWLWRHRIPLGRLILIDGDPSAGKSFLTLAIAAAVSRGGVLPGGEKLNPSGVLLISVEDGFADTVRPRLDGLKADVARIAIPNPKRGLAPGLINVSYIESVVKQIGPQLVVIDPVVQFLGRKDADKAGQVRELLAPLMALAEKYGFAGLIVRHLNKQSNTKAMYRGSGSIDFMAACRGAFVVAEDPEEKGRRILAHVKNSLGPKMPSLSFYIDADGFRWGEECDTTADDLLSPADSGKGRERVQMDRATEFLKSMLASGAVSSVKLEEEAEKQGLRRAIWRAKSEMGIRATKGMGGRFFWSLPNGREG